MPLANNSQDLVKDQAQEEITILLGQIAQGSDAAKEKLMTLVYDKLHKVASAMMWRERSSHTLESTDLVHEAYFKLFVGKPLQARNRSYFFGAAANAMRQVLIDYARRIAVRPEGKRIPLLDAILETARISHRVDMLDLDRALSELRRMNARQCEVVTLRFFAGMQWSEIASCLDVSTSTVEKDWQASRAWLYEELKRDEQ